MWELTTKNQTLRLFVVSMLTLFVEILCIRWLAAELLLMRVFPNLTLTAILIGFSIGLATSREKQPSKVVLLFAALTTFFLLICATGLHLNKMDFQTPERMLMSLLVVGSVIVNLTVMFCSLGRLLGTSFSNMPTLKAYSINLFGSIAGILLYALLSFVYSPPSVWILIAAALVWFLCGKKYIPVIGIILALIAASVYKDVTWSPYGAIKLVPEISQVPHVKNNYDLYISGEYFHGALHLDPVIDFKSTLPAKYDKNRYYRAWLELPFISTCPSKVLVLGAGSGNDVQNALLHNAKKVDSVEINPFIAACGFNKHPDQPYRDPRVSVFVEDARTFLRYSREKYDLIDFAYLDPGSIVRQSSFLRTDNFVYTKESIKSALNHLAPDGLIALSFATGGNEPATRRLYKTILDVIGKPPICFVHDPMPGEWGSCFFLFGPGAKNIDPEIIKAFSLRPWPGKGEYSDNTPATDDWPFLYLEYTVAAVIIYFLMVGSAAVLPILLYRKGLSSKAIPSEFIPMFFLGLAFMLMETKSITKLALLFGSTWINSSIVVFVILCLAVLANWLVDRFSIRRTLPAYLGIVVMLLIDYFLEVPASAGADPLLISFLFALMTCAPVFFGSLIFSILLNRSQNPIGLLSANVLGVAFGGLIENLCIFIGIKALSLVALLLYLCSGLPALLLALKKREAK